MLPGARRQINISIVLLACFFALGVAPSLAQSVADIARQERERQKNLSRPSQHIYTNDDLERSHILVPEDRRQIEADASDPSPVLDAEPGNTTSQSILKKETPLGDVARHYRLLKRVQEIQQADRTDVLPGKTPEMASPSLTRPAMISIPKPRLKQLGLTPQPEPRERVTRDDDGKIRVNQGDSLWMLAARYLGNGIRWHEILAVNPQLKDPNLIHAGEWIWLPIEGSASLNGSVRVRKGDTLWKLAQLNFGSGLAWSCIAGANPAVLNFNRIYSGQVLTLPARCAPTPGWRNH
jgi:nucleoid-associated protein YgaU